MALTITDVDAFTTPVTTVADGESADQVEFAKAPQILANRTAWIKNRMQKIEVFTANGTWTKEADALSVDVYCIGGGGGGGGGVSGANTAGGGGGGSGRISRIVWHADNLPATVACTVGAGGAGGAIDTDGTNGGLSYFGAYSTETGGGTSGKKAITSVGGNGGAGANGGGSGSGTTAPGVAGVANTLADAILGVGYNGETGSTLVGGDGGGGTGSVIYNGQGGAVPGGGGGGAAGALFSFTAALPVATSGSGATPGTGGSFFGAGGGGGFDNAAGGAGADGAVIVITTFDRV